MNLKRLWASAAILAMSCGPALAHGHHHHHHHSWWWRDPSGSGAGTGVSAPEINAGYLLASLAVLAVFMLIGREKLNRASLDSSR